MQNPKIIWNCSVLSPAPNQLLSTALDPSVPGEWGQPRSCHCLAVETGKSQIVQLNTIVFKQQHKRYIENRGTTMAKHLRESNLSSRASGCEMSPRPLCGCAAAAGTDRAAENRRLGVGLCRRLGASSGGRPALIPVPDTELIASAAARRSPTDRPQRVAAELTPTRTSPPPHTHKRTHTQTLNWRMSQQVNGMNEKRDAAGLLRSNVKMKIIIVFYASKM